MFHHVRVTATFKGWRKGKGKWSHPDVTGVQVWRFDWVPDVTIEVSSFELKRAGDGTKLESIYEAASHARWAHRASLVIEEVSTSRYDRFMDELKRFGLGLYLINRRPDGQLDVQEVAEPQLQVPEPSQLDELLKYFFSCDHRQAQNYKAQIGKA